MFFSFLNVIAGHFTVLLYMQLVVMSVEATHLIAMEIQCTVYCGPHTMIYGVVIVVAVGRSVTYMHN